MGALRQALPCTGECTGETGPLQWTLEEESRDYHREIGEVFQIVKQCVSQRCVSSRRELNKGRWEAKGAWGTQDQASAGCWRNRSDTVAKAWGRWQLRRVTAIAVTPSRQLVASIPNHSWLGWGSTETCLPTPFLLSFHPGASNGELATGAPQDRAWGSEQGKQE